MKNLILTLIITLPITLWGQGWEYIQGGEFMSRGHHIQQTNDGGFIVTGFSYEVIDGGIFLLKIDQNGDEQWINYFGGEEEDYGFSVKETNDGGYITTGYTEVNGVFKMYLFKTDINGVLEWDKIFSNKTEYNYMVGMDILQTFNNGYVICGYMNGGLFLIKTDLNGIEQWRQIYSGDFDNNSFNKTSIDQTYDNGFIITSTIESSSNQQNIKIIKTDENGNEQWSQIFGGLGSDLGSSGHQTVDGGFIFTGTEETNNNSFNLDIWLIKTDENGNIEWDKNYDLSDEDHGLSVQQTQDSGYIITGGTYNSNTSYDLILIKTDENGNEQWTKTFGDNDTDIGFSVLQSSDNSYVVCGWYEDFNGIERVYIIKTDDQGNITSTFEIPLPNPDRKLEKTINLKGQEVKPQTNTPIIEIFDDSSTQKKIIIE